MLPLWIVLLAVLRLALAVVLHWSVPQRDATVQAVQLGVLTLYSGQEPDWWLMWRMREQLHQFIKSRDRNLRGANWANWMMFMVNALWGADVNAVGRGCETALGLLRVSWTQWTWQPWARGEMLLEVLKYTLSKIPLRIVAIAPNLAYVTGLTHVKKKHWMTVWGAAQKQSYWEILETATSNEIWVVPPIEDTLHSFGR
jgi:hypothetical protein